MQQWGVRTPQCYELYAGVYLQVQAPAAAAAVAAAAAAAAAVVVAGVAGV